MDLIIPDIKELKYACFRDDRGYFTKHFRFAGNFINGDCIG